MFDNFLKLDQQKQQNIINAAISVFAQHPYAHANTEEIAFLAGISKGLLFYYFKDKKSLYLYLCQHCETVLLQYLDQLDLSAKTDFFEIMNEGAKAKLSLIHDHPYMMEFVIKAWFDKDVPFHEDITVKFQLPASEIYMKYFQNIDTSKFKEGVDYIYLYRMLQWMSEGYLFEKQRLQLPLCIDEMMIEFHRWEQLFKQLLYKEECL